MKMLSIIALSVLFWAKLASAADVVCACEAPHSCSDVKINFVPSNPGVYMNVEYAYGERNLEGFAAITRRSDEGDVIYKLGNFVLIQKDGTYSLPNRPAKCS